MCRCCLNLCSSHMCEPNGQVHLYYRTELLCIIRVSASFESGVQLLQQNYGPLFTVCTATLLRTRSSSGMEYYST